ncbi:MAG: anhydro-N-acetylmuramic acid kinase [Gammaproteobacteria bacterium]|nr:anhydro-N-acetylmuramic acid kinase [Gammaproteobacteria bacterium]
MTNDKFIGLMSGTSADAIDAALVDFSGGLPRLAAWHQHPLPNAFRELVLALSQSCATVLPGQIASLDIQAGRLFAKAVLALLEQENIPAEKINAIGSHGQTLYHLPEGAFPYTWQIGDPNIIVQHTGITTVADFRRMDVAAGGQGAPLAPAFHNAVLRTLAEDRVILNLGGIANITVLPADPAAPVIGFDTGPGNALLDAWSHRHLGSAMDEGGRWAASGKVHRQLLAALRVDPFFQRLPPKSTGRDYFNLAWLEKRLTDRQIPPVDVQASLLQLTADTVSEAVLPYAPQQVLVCGGGARNPILMQSLAEQLSPARTGPTSVYGVDPDWMEAMCFAWLAKQTLEGKPGNLPSVTGASEALVLGGIFSASHNYRRPARFCPGLSWRPNKVKNSSILENTDISTY